MGTHRQESGTSDEEVGAGVTISRRKVLAGGAVGLGGLLAGGLLTSGIAGASPVTGYQSVPDWGKSRRVIWANGGSGTWDLSYDVGISDAVRFLGWSYKKVAMPESTYSSSQVIQTLNEAIAEVPDVLIAPDWVEGEGVVFAKAQKAGIFVISNNASNFLPQLASLGIAACTSNPITLGVKSGEVLMDTLVAAGKKTGTIIMGNPFPMNPNQQGEVVGCQQAIAACNKANGTHFVGVELADNSGTDEATGVALWKAKITQLGSSFIAGFAAADASTTAAVKAYQTSGFHARQWPLAAIDVTTPSLASMQEGWVLCTVDAGIYMQGWLPVMLAWQYIQRGYRAQGEIDCSGSAVTKKNLASFIKANNLEVTLGKDYGVLVAG